MLCHATLRDAALSCLVACNVVLCYAMLSARFVLEMYISVSRVMTLEVDAIQLASWDAKDRRIARKLVEFQTGIAENLPIPIELRDNQLITRILNKSAEIIGERFVLVLEGLKRNSEIKWEEDGVYKFGAEEDGGRIKSIIHRPSGIEAHVFITGWAGGGGWAWQAAGGISAGTTHLSCHHHTHPSLKIQDHCNAQPYCIDKPPP